MRTRQTYWHLRQYMLITQLIDELQKETTCELSGSSCKLQLQLTHGIPFLARQLFHHSSNAHIYRNIHAVANAGSNRVLLHSCELFFFVNLIPA
jgi:hypothetical protein